MAKLNLEKTEAFINQASQVFNRYGYYMVFRHPTVMAVCDSNYAKLGEIHCVADPSEVPEGIENEAIGYSDTGHFYWYLDEDLEDAIFDLETRYETAQELIRDLVSVADSPLKLEGKQLLLF
jgi:hypothetical protein